MIIPEKVGVPIYGNSLPEISRSLKPTPPTKIKSMDFLRQKLPVREDPTFSVRTKFQNYFANANKDSQNDTMKNFLNLPEKSGVYSDFDKTPSPGNQLKKTCPPSDNEKEMTESVYYHEELNSKSNSLLTVHRKNFEDFAPSPNLRVVMKRGDRTFFKELNFEDDLLKVDSTLQNEFREEDSQKKINPKEIIRPSHGVSQFAFKAQKTLDNQNFIYIETNNSEAREGRGKVVKSRSAKKHSNEFKDVKKSWKKIVHVFQSVLLFQREEVNQVHDANIISEEIRNFRLRKVNEDRRSYKSDFSKEDLTQEAFDHIRNGKIFCDCSTIGSPKHIQIMKQLLQADPKRFILDRDDPNHFINCCNKEGQRPLYLAAKHGNLDVIKFLVENNANLHLTSKVVSDSKIEETPLEIAVKWSHVSVVEYLLQNCLYSQYILRNCQKITDNENMKIVLRKYCKQREKNKSCFNFLCYSG